MNIALWVSQVLLAVMYGVAGVLKAFMTARAQKDFPWATNRPAAFVKFIGTAELLGAIGVVLPMVTGILAWLTPVAAIGLSLVQVLAIVAIHLPEKNWKVVPMNLVLLAASVFVVVGRFSLFGL